MRVNQPVTTREIDLPDGEPLVSRTDTKGIMTFVNHVFMEVSGFSEAELVGAPHNLVRHPDMPPAAFANLWSTIQSGRSWDGLVKNRAKNGDFYWVNANVTPEMEDGRVIGYISIRSKPTRAQTAEAEQVYGQIRAGIRSGFNLQEGALVRRGLGTRLRAAWGSVTGRLIVINLVACLVIGLGGWFDFSSLAESNARLAALHERDMTSVERLRGVQDRLRDGRAQLAQVTVGLASGAIPADAAPRIHSSLAQLEGLWRAWRAEPLTPEQRQMAERFERAEATLRNDGIEPALAAAGRADAPAIATLFTKTLPPLFQAALAADDALIAQQVDLAKVTYAAAAGELERHLVVAGVLAVAGLIVMAALGWGLTRVLRRSLGSVESNCRAIAAGRSAGALGRGMAREFNDVMAALRSMRAHLAFSTWERAETARRGDMIRHETVERMAEAIEREAGGAVRTVADRSVSMAADATAMAGSAERVGANAERVTGAATIALTNAQVVAAASEELAASIREIAVQIEQASQVAKEGAARGVEARTTIGTLSEAAERIGAIVVLINNIASQTNLLALNATIEASRAGEAGRGFAVVAGEVKNLASQTAHATEEISRQIGALRDATAASVEVVAEIGRTIDSFASVSTSVATAIEEQTAATHEIARNVAENGAAVQAVTSLMAEVSQEAALVGRQADTLRATVGTVAGDVDALRHALVKTVRTATEEANRRIEPRADVESACTLRFGNRSVKGRLRDLSRRGAAVEAPGLDATIAPGAEGVLVLTGGVDAEAAFEVRARLDGGQLHLQFIPGKARPGFHTAIEALLRSSVTDTPRQLRAG